MSTRGRIALKTVLWAVLLGPLAACFVSGNDAVTFLEDSLLALLIALLIVIVVPNIGQQIASPTGRKVYRVISVGSGILLALAGGFMWLMLIAFSGGHH